MKKLHYFFLIIICYILASCSKADSHDIQGMPIRLSDYQGKYIIVNYWADWCKPCLTEMPELNDLYTRYKTQLVVFGVNYDQLPDQNVQSFAKKLGIVFPQLRSFPIEKFGITQINTIPLTLIISPKGQLQEILHGPQSIEALRTKLNL